MKEQEVPADVVGLAANNICDAAMPMMSVLNRGDVAHKIYLLPLCLDVCNPAHHRAGPTPGKRGGLASGRASGYKRSCSKTAMHEES